MPFTVRIPQNYAARFISNLRDTGTSARMQDAAVRNLNIQPDGSILVRSSAETPFDAAKEILILSERQNLRIPFAAIRGFQTFADTSQEARKHGVSVAPAPIKNAAVAPKVLGGRKVTPQNIAVTSAGDIEDLSDQERVVPGQIVEGPTPFTESRTIIPSFTRSQARLGEGIGEQATVADLFNVAPGSVAATAGVLPTVTDDNDLDTSEIEAFAQAERDRLARLREIDDDDDDDNNGQPSIPANLPAFWRERYDEYLALSPELQNIILELQIKDFVELEPYRTIATEEGGGVSEVVGADVDPDDLAEFLENNPGATVNPDGSISFAPQTFDSSTIDVTGRIPDPLQLEGFAATDLQDILNIFYANPDRYISKIPVFEDVYDPDTGQVIRQRQVGTQQVLSPVAQAALQAFSTQRGAESADVASRFGTATPFGVIAGMGGETAAADAKSLAELQARAGVTSPFGALGTGSTIGDISTILRGGLDVEEQLALAGLQARGGISPEQRLAEQRMALLPQLFQTSPQALGGLQRVLGEQQLQQALTPFFSAGSFQPSAPVTDSVPFAQGPSGTNLNINPDLVENVSGRSPFAGGPVTQTISGTTQPVSAVSPGFRPTVGRYQRAGLFERGGLEAEAGMAGQELTPFLQEVTPLGASTRPGGLGAQRATRFTY